MSEEYYDINVDLILYAFRQLGNKLMFVDWSIPRNRLNYHYVLDGEPLPNFYSRGEINSELTICWTDNRYNLYANIRYPQSFREMAVKEAFEESKDLIIDRWEKDQEYMSTTSGSPPHYLPHLFIKSEAHKPDGVYDLVDQLINGIEIYYEAVEV